MIYTILRLGADGIYTIGRLSYDGLHYLVYGHVDTPTEIMSNEMTILRQRLDSESIELREIKSLLQQIAQTHNISIKQLDTQDSDMVYIH